MNPALAADDLWFSYPRGGPVLRGVGLAVQPGQITVVLGASGSGKTTLFRLFKGLLVPTRGTIALDGVTVGRQTGTLRRRIAYIPQQLGLVRTMTVLDNVLTGALARTGTIRSLLGLFPRETVDEARAALTLLGIDHKAESKVATLSGGERQRCAIARAMLQHASVILADEFVSQLDAATAAGVLETMRALVDKGATLVMTSHHLDVVHDYADQVVVMRQGQVALDSAAELTDSGAIRELLAR